MRVSTASTLLPRGRVLSPSCLPSKRSYSDHSDHHHGSAADEPTGPESFVTPAWRNALIAGVALYGVYHFLPSGFNSENSITKFIAKFDTPSTVWADINTERTVISKEIADGKLLSQSAERPVIQRSRFPSLLDQASPRLVGVGQNVDVTNFVAKRDDQ